MNRRVASLCLCCGLAHFLPLPAAAVTIATVPVGGPGNAPDPAAGSLYGAVPYNYRIGTYDVTNAQYVEFLNAKASVSDRYGLWDVNMAPAPGQFEGAISRSGSGPYSYSVKPGYANKPVIYVSWYDAVRFVNWLTNGQGNADTESGTYLITNGGNDSGTVLVPDATQRALWATTNLFHWLLPSENEWYKAAYYNPANGTYYAYPFQSNSQPAGLVPPGNTNSGDFYNNGYPAYNYDGNGSYLTDVGAYPNSLNPFGSFDMGGDVFQWNDTTIGSSRGLRGGYWNLDPSISAASFRTGDNPALESNTGVGFRVASVPEPSTGLLAVLACGLLWWKRKSVWRVA
jgi:sulfatase modifying factor 1